MPDETLNKIADKVCAMYDDIYNAILSHLCLRADDYSHDLHHDIVMRLMTDKAFNHCNRDEIIKHAKRLAKNSYCNRNSRVAKIAYVGDTELLNNLNYANDIQEEET